jgi:hypothetical protein
MRKVEAIMWRLQIGLQRYGATVYLDTLEEEEEQSKHFQVGRIFIGLIINRSVGFFGE